MDGGGGGRHFRTVELEFLRCSSNGNDVSQRSEKVGGTALMGDMICLHEVNTSLYRAPERGFAPPKAIGDPDDVT
jgi:hypothetical protein